MLGRTEFRLRVDRREPTTALSNGAARSRLETKQSLVLDNLQSAFATTFTGNRWVRLCAPCGSADVRSHLDPCNHKGEHPIMNTQVGFIGLLDAKRC